jgi:hypothetical protein
MKARAGVVVSLAAASLGALGAGAVEREISSVEAPERLRIDAFAAIRRYVAGHAVVGAWTISDPALGGPLKLVLSGTRVEKIRAAEGGRHHALVRMTDVPGGRPYDAEFLIGPAGRGVNVVHIEPCRMPSESGSSGGSGSFFDLESDEVGALREEIRRYYEGIDRAFTLGDAELLASYYSPVIAHPMTQVQILNWSRWFFHENGPAQSKNSTRIVSISRCGALVMVDFEFKSARTGAGQSGSERDRLERVGDRWIKISCDWRQID